MDQMGTRGQFYKCLKENSQSKPTVNLSIYPEGRGEEKKKIHAVLQQAAIWWGEVLRKAQNPKVLEKKKHI